MTFNNWKIETIETIEPDEFYNLIITNKQHIEKTFPVTLASCINLEKTTTFIIENKGIEKNKLGYYFYIRNLESNSLIGYLGLKNLNNKISKCELFYFIDKNFEGKGIISNAVHKVIDRCFNELMMNKVFICTSKNNSPSQRIALKNGFQQEGILREEFKNGNGILEDIVYFGLLKSDYSLLKSV